MSHNDYHTSCFKYVFDQAILYIDKDILLLYILCMPHDHDHSPSNDNFRHLFHPPVLHIDQDILLLDIFRLPHDNYNNTSDHNFRHLFHPSILCFV